MISTDNIEKVERLIQLSEPYPVLPDEFIPWHTQEEDELLLTQELVSLEGHSFFDTLTETRKRGLCRHEVVLLGTAAGINISIQLMKM